MVKPTDIPRWQAAMPKPKAMWVLPVPLLPMAMTFSRRSMYSRAGQFHHQGLVLRGDSGEVEAIQTLDCREAGRPDPPLHHALVAVGEYLLCKALEVLRVVYIFGNKVKQAYV